MKRKNELEGARRQADSAEVKMEQSRQNQLSSLLEYWLILSAHRWVIAGLILLSVCGTAFVVLNESHLYEGRVEFVALAPTWENNRGALVAPVMQNLGRPFRPLKLVLLESIYWELYARVLVEAIVEELDLQAHYGTATLGQTVSTLEGHRLIQRTDQGTMQVRIVDRDPQMAAAIANAHTRHLDLLDRRLLTQSAARRKQFIKARLRETELKLSKAEEEWFPFRFKLDASGGGLEQDANKAEKDAGGETPGKSQGQEGQEREQEQITPLTRTTRLKTDAMEMEVELARLRTFATAKHPQAVRLETQLKTLRRAIDQLEHGRPNGRLGSKPSSFVPSLAELPEVALSSGRFARTAKVQAHYYLQWKQMLEDTIMEEALDLPRVWVLDRAVPEERGRRLWQKLVVACGLAFVLGVQLCFLFVYMARLRDLQLSANREQS